jgi:hypothetical protein
MLTVVRPKILDTGIKYNIFLPKDPHFAFPMLVLRGINQTQNSLRDVALKPIQKTQKIKQG